MKFVIDIVRKRKCEIDSSDVLGYSWIIFEKSVITFDEHPEVIGQLEIMKQWQESDASRYVGLHRDLEKAIVWFKIRTRIIS